MSVFNEKIEWLKESVNSILNQTYRNFEFIIVVDNPSIEKEKVLYLQDVALTDDRVLLTFNESNIGLALSLNKGICLSKGEFIARMDADDISELDRLEREMSFMSKTNADMVSTNGVVIDDNSNYVRNMGEKPFDPTELLPFANMILHPSVLIKKSVLESVGLYRNFRRSQDYDLWLRLLTSGFIIRILNERLLRYRISNSNLTNSNRLEQYYSHLYQQKLFLKRKKTGFDSYSDDDFKKYLNSKRITTKKNNRCQKCFSHLEKANLLRDNGKFFIHEVLFAFLVFPSIVLRTFLNHFNKPKII